MKKENTARLMMISSMLIFGTIGIFVKNLSYSSGVVAFVRSVIGSVFIFILALFTKEKPDVCAIKKNLKYLLVSGVFLGINWVFLFEAYRYTGVATGTLCYYLAPVFVVFFSPVAIGEKLSGKKIFFSCLSLLGMVFVSGVGDAKPLGVMFGVLAAVLYAAIVLLNKKLKDIKSTDITLLQLAISAVVMLIYVLITEDMGSISFQGNDAVMLLTVGVIHTGVAYVLYFAALKNMRAQSAAIYSYIDPVCALILSAVFLSEHLTVWVIIGAVLILGSTLLSEILDR